MDNDLKIIYSVWVFAVAFLMLFPLISASPALIDDIVSYYKEDEQDTTGSGTIYDALGTNNGTNVGPDNSTGKINTAYDFDGANNYINVGKPMPEGANVRTINAWIYYNSAQSDTRMTIFGTGTSSTIGYQFNFQINYIGADTVSFHSYGLLKETAIGTLTPDAWNMVTITMDGETLGDIEFFINGDFASSTILVGSSTNVINTQGTEQRIGTREGNREYFNGTIDEVGIWNRVLSEAEVSDLYNSGDGLAYPFVVDTCTCAGLNNNWEIDMSDNCEITEACDLGTGTLSFTGAGWCKCNASVDTTNLGDPGASGTLYIQDSCKITID